MNGRPRTTPALAGLVSVVALGALVAVPVAMAADDGSAGEVRTDAGDLGGYSVVGAAAPMTMLFFEPVIPAPVDPGEPHFEASESYTRASLATGPTSRAVASSFWPGPLVGDGMESFAEGESYPVKADARYPQGPEEEAKELPGGAGMRAAARGLDVAAEATSKRSPSAEAATYGNVASTSTATAADGVVRTDVLSAASDVALLGGLVTIASVRTTLEATSDGVSGATAGATEVSGMTISGNGFVVDEEGPRPVQEGSPAPGSLPVPTSLPGADELREALGVEVELLPHVEETDGPSASRSAGGLRITIDTTMMRQALDQLPIVELTDALPPELATEIYPLLSLSPRIVYIFGRGSVRATASEPFDLDFPLPDLPPAPAADAGGFDAVHGDAAMAADFSGFPAPQNADEPVAAPAPVGVVPASAELPELFTGIPLGVALLALMAIGLGGYGLTGLSGLVFGAGSGGPCSLGAPRRTPDLRGGA